jgi:hypothetical protein
MSEATFILRAVDQTKQAFASVQNSLTKINRTTKSVLASFRGFVLLTAVVKIGEGINKSLEDAEANAQNLGKTQEDIDKLTRATGAVDNAFNRLKDTAVLAAGAVLGVGDAVGEVSEAESASAADKIRADRDQPKIAELTETVKRLKEELNGIGGSPSEAFARLGLEIERINNATKEIALSEELDALNREAKVLELTGEQTKIAAEAFADYEKSVMAVTEAYEDFEMQQKSAEEQQAQIENQIMEISEGISKIKAVLPADGFSFFSATAEELAAIEKLIPLQDKLVKLMGRREVLETNLQFLARNSGDIIAQSFEDAIFSGEKLSNVLKQLGLDLVRLVFSNLITQPLAAGIGGFLQGIFRAEGGPVGSGKPYIVGERGPELFVPGSSGSIVPNDAMRGGGSGGTSVNITYHISSGVSRAELTPILDTERRRLKAEIPDMVRRGGSYRAAFA